uniref:Stc1 domain n=1 Tax=Siphoviridae sp. ctCS019 TaxID=2825378 RepID=A0A8S5U5A6_9CAUD|nr:MAG TPA: Stc1 domain [Siphoviridae sp. ctCS019]
METKTCEICGKTLPLSAFSKSYKWRCKECVARQTKEKRNGTAATTHKPIDWEQRRYEIAKAAMVGQLASPVVEGIDPNPSMPDVCKWSVMFADALINELKKHDNG